MAGKGNACSSVNDAQAEAIKKMVKLGLANLNINTGDLSNVAIEAALNRLMSEKGYTIETLFSIDHKQEIISAIARARSESIKEKQALENVKIGNATVHIGDIVKKVDPGLHLDHLYVFTDNLQAYNAFAKDKIAAPGLIVPEGGATVNVGSTSAAIRTNTNEDKYPNTFGLVVKKNAQAKDKKWLNNGQGAFDDTDEDFKAFITANERVVKQIKELLMAPDSPYTDFHMVGKIAMEKAGLPKRFAEALRTMLQTQLGIDTQVLPSAFGKDLWGLEVQKFGKQATAEKEKSPKQKAQEKDEKDAAESLSAERPALLSDSIVITPQSSNLLARLFPDVQERHARIDFISTIFSQVITGAMEEILSQYEELIKDPNHSIEDEKVYAALTSGTESERRRAFLELVPITREDGTTVSAAEHAILELQTLMRDTVRKAEAMEQGILSEDKAIELVFDKGTTQIAEEFKREAADNGWQGVVLRNMKVRRLRRLGSAFKTMLDPRVFGALMKEAAADIEFNENIRIIFDTGTPIIDTAGEDVQASDDEDEGSVDNRSGLSLTKYKLLNPAKTLSTRMKVTLSRLYKRRGGKYEYGALGQRIRMNPAVAYYILLHHFSVMNQSADFESAINEAADKYQWFAPLADMLDEDIDLKREFYTTFRRVFVPYVLIGSNGKLINLNYTAGRESFMQEVTRLYEGHLPLSENSIYDSEGLSNPRNILKVRKWVTSGKKIERSKESPEERIKKHPFAWVKSIFDNPGRRDFTAENIIRAVSILRGEEEGVPGIEELLHAIGVSTETLDIDALVPYINDKLREALNSDDPDTRYKAFTELTETYSERVRGNISKIIQSAINITREDKGFSANDNLLEKFKNSYFNIADALAISSEAFSQASFAGMENKPMFSYTVPDRISIIVGILHNAKTQEEAQLWLEKEYGQYDFYKGIKSDEWLNSWMEAVFNNPAVRKAIEYKSVLGFNSRAKGNSIQDVENEPFEDGIITAMFSAQEASDGTKMGWYRNPLFSDSSALVLLKMPRDGKQVGEDPSAYKNRILDKLVKVLRQEIERITFVMNQSPENSKIEFFNDKKSNGSKFNYFPELNSKKSEILRTLAQITRDSSTATEAKQARDNYLKSLLVDIIEGEMLADGSRVGGLLEEFLSSIDDERGAKILKSIASVETGDKEQDAADYDLEKELEEDNVEDMSPEEREAAKVALSEKQREEVREKLTEFFYNDLLGQIQFTQLIGGDIAQYKNFNDFVKRCKENYAAGERMYSLDEQGKPITEKAMYMEDFEGPSTTYSSIRQLLDPENDKLSDWEKSIYRGALKSFLKICKTDGQSLRTLDSYKKLFQSYGGRWTPAMDRAFNNIKSGTFSAADFQALWNPIKPFMVTSESMTLKDNEGNVRNEKVQTQHKNSEYLITALFDALDTALNASPQLRGLQRFMEEHGIDVMHFHSVVKHGGHDFFDINYDYDFFLRDFLGVDPNDPDAILPDTVEYTVGDKTFTFDITKGIEFDDFTKALTKALENGEITQEQYNKTLDKYSYEKSVSALNDKLEKGDITQEQYNARIKDAIDADTESVVKALNAQLLDANTGQIRDGMIKEFPLEDYMIVQPSDDHLIDHDALFGSQARNIVPADLPEGFTTTVKINGRDVTLNREQAIEYYNTLIVDQLLDSFDTVNKRFTDDQALSDYLQEVMRNNPKYGDDIKEALTIDPKTGRFKMPLNSPNLRNKVEELLLSVFKNNLQRQKIRGGNVVLVSNFGYSDKLKVKYKNNNPSEGIEYIPAYMPAYMRDIFEDYLVEKTDKDGSPYWTIDFDALQKNHQGDSEDILKIIGYRIPTEDKYSMMPIKIVGFMPVVAGTTIMLPADIISMSGTDFDIDKLFLMIRTTVRETFGPNLATEFRKWLSPEIKKSLANTDPEQDRVIDRIFRRKQGFTDQELDSFAEKSALFTQFMDEKGFEFALDKPHYRIKRGKNIYNEDNSINTSETSRLSDYNKRERHDIRNNMLIDVIWSILTSPEGSRLSMLPGSYPGVKRGSRQQWILNNPAALQKFVEFAGGAHKVYEKLMSMDAGDLEEFFDTYAETSNPFTIGSYVTKHRNLMDGNALIGMFAVNSSNHYKLQFLSPGTRDASGHYITSDNILLNEKNKFLFTLPGKSPIVIELVSPQKSPITGVAIGRTAAEFQAASPDNGKDPCLGDLNASVKTAYRINFLIHMGFAPEIVGMLNTIDDFVAYGDSQEAANDVPFDGDIARIIELVTKYRLSETGTLTDEIDKSDAKKIANWIHNIFDCARTFSKTSNVSRVDSPNGALPVKVAEVIQQMFKMEDFFKTAKSADCEIIGLDRLIDDNIDPSNYGSMEELRDAILKTPIPRLQAVYTLGIKAARTVAGGHLVQLRKPVVDAARRLRAEIKQTLTDGQGLKVLQTFFNDMTMYLLSTQGSLFAGDTQGKSIMEMRNYYIHDFPAKLKAFLEEKNPDGSYKHASIRNLTLIQRINNGNRSGIKFKNFGKVSSISRKYYTEAMDAMLYSEDPDVQKLAIDLLMYAYYDNGLNFGPNNYGVFFTTFFLTSLPGLVDVLERANAQAESDPSMLNNFINQFLLNHKDFVFAPYGSYKEAIKKEGDVLTIAEKDADFLRAGRNSTGSFIRYIRYGKDIYQRTLGDDGAAQSVVRYEKIAYNDTAMVGGKKDGKNYTPFYDATSSASDIAWDELERRGAVSSKKAEKDDKKDDKDEKKGQQAPAEKEGVEGKDAPTDREFDEQEQNRITEGLDGREQSDHDEVEELEAKEAKEEKATKYANEILSKLDTEKELNAPEERKEPSLTDFADNKDAENRLCPPGFGNKK